MNKNGGDGETPLYGRINKYRRNNGVRKSFCKWPIKIWTGKNHREMLDE